jgi:hypothetical protein
MTDGKPTITISLDEYVKLLEDSKFLTCLLGAGVDNWEGYDDAQEMLSEMNEEESNPIE